MALRNKHATNSISHISIPSRKSTHATNMGGDANSVQGYARILLCMIMVFLPYHSCCAFQLPRSEKISNIGYSYQRTISHKTFQLSKGSVYTNNASDEKPERNRKYRGEIKKRQTAIFDGAEFMSIAAVLRLESEQRLYDMELQSKDNVADMNEDSNDDTEAVLEAAIPSKRAGYMTFITAVLEGGDRILGIQSNNMSDVHSVEIEDNISVQKDSIVKIPKGISDSDAISTAVAALGGVRCAYPTQLTILSDDDDDETNDTMGTTKRLGVSIDEQAKVVVLGGGEYACFVANAMDALGAKVCLVTTRPMSLKDTPLNPLRDSNGKRPLTRFILSSKLSFISLNVTILIYLPQLDQN